MIPTARVRLLAASLVLAVIASACGGTSESNDPAPPAADGGDDNAAVGDDTSSSDGDGIGVVEPPDEAPSTGPVRGGVLRYGLNAEPDGLNPTSSALAAPGLTMANAVFDTLAAYDIDGNAVPHLAESFTPNADFTSWTVKLREGILFHDGTPLNADAAIISANLIREDPLIGLTVKPFLDPDNPIEKVDEMTFAVNLLEPNAFYPASMAEQIGIVASPTWLEAALDNPELNQEPVGTGPFMFDRRVQDSETRFVRNPDYWNGEVYLDAIEFLPIPDPDIRVSIFLDEGLDGLHSNEPEAVDVLKSRDDVLNVLDGTASEQLDMMNSAAPPFDDIRARQALTMATPQNNYVALLGIGVSPRADSPFAPGSPYHNPDVVQLTDRPDEAAALAAEYCADFPDNCTNNKINITRLTSGPSVDQTREAELLAEGWSVAFNTSFQEVPQDSIIQNVAFGLYEVADWRQFDAVDPVTDNVWLMCRTISGLSLNWPRFCDEDRDALLNQAQAETDPAARALLYQELSVKLNADYLYIFHTHTVWDVAYREGVHGACDRLAPDGVTELRCQVRGYTFFDSVWMDQ